MHDSYLIELLFDYLTVSVQGIYSMCSLQRVALTALVFVMLAALNPTLAQEQDSVKEIQDIAQQVSVLKQFDTIYRLTESLVFWQSVAVMGAAFGWEFSYENSSGKNIWPWTLRLYNFLGESETEAVYAARGVARSKIASKETKIDAEKLYAGHLEMREIAVAIHEALLDGRMDEAARLFETRTLGLRRKLANDSYSAMTRLRSEISQTVLDVRRGH